jgi:hypothetical protein
MEKKGQVTIFIIIAIVIVSAIASFFLFKGNVLNPEIGESPEKNPGSFLSTCMEEKIRETVSKISSQGGYISNPLNKTFKFDGENSFTDISYLCYTSNYYIPCVNQEPMLIHHLKSEIKNYISEDVGKCFDRLTSSLSNQGFTVDAKYKDFEVELTEGKIALNVDAELTLTKTGETSSYTELKIITLSKFYDTAMVVQEIVSQEAKYCNFEYLGYMTLYPQWEIDKFRTSDSIVIYTVKNKDSADKFKFAIRSCAIRPGI